MSIQELTDGDVRVHDVPVRRSKQVLRIGESSILERGEAAAAQAHEDIEQLEAEQRRLLKVLDGTAVADARQEAIRVEMELAKRRQDALLAVDETLTNYKESRARAEQLLREAASAMKDAHEARRAAQFAVSRAHRLSVHVQPLPARGNRELTEFVRPIFREGFGL